MDQQAAAGRDDRQKACHPPTRGTKCVSVCVHYLTFFGIQHSSMCMFIITPLWILSESCQLYPGLMYILHDSHWQEQIAALPVPTLQCVGCVHAGVYVLYLNLQKHLPFGSMSLSE